MTGDDNEEELLRAVALQNANAVLIARRRAEEELSRTLAMMQATLEATTDAILVTDGGGAVTGSNANYVDMWRVPREVIDLRDHRKLLEVCGRQFRDPGPFIARVEEIYASSPPDSYDLLELADGRWVERFSRVQVVRGTNVGRVWSFRDITERRRAERLLADEQERLRITLASIGDAVISTDADGRVTFLNAEAERLTGWSQLEAAGRPLVDVFVIVNETTRQPVENPALRALREGRVVGLANHTVLVSRNGTERPIDDSAAPMLDAAGAAIGSVLVFRDVTERRRAEEDRARLAAIVETSDDAIVSKTLDGVIRSWNAGAERVFGYTAAEAVGRHITLIIPEELVAEERAILERLRRGERIEHFETVRVAKDGRRLDISLTVSPLRDGEGRITGASKVARDVTGRKRSEEALRDQNRVVETLYAIGTRLSAELELGKILQSVTDETTALTGAQFGAFFYNGTDEKGDAMLLYTLSGAPREAFSKFPHPRATAIFEPTFKGHGPVRLEDVTQDPRYGRNAPYHGMPEGHLPVRSYLAVPVKSRSGEVLGGLFFGHPEPAVFTDQHERMVVGVASHAAVAIDNARLFERVVEQDRRKDEFIALLAHELRNPLAPVRNGLQVMRLAAGNPDAVGKARAMMERQIGHMVRLIDDLLDVSRISRNKMDLRLSRVLLADVVGSAVETARPAIEEGGHQLEVSLPTEPVFLDADLTRLAQVLSNLLTNSSKYTERGGRIWLTVARDGAEVVVTVKDTGIGIPAASLPTIFDMFSQVDRSIERSTGGLGIGLALVKGLTEMHGGTVAVESEGPGRGSTFTLRLPAPGNPHVSAAPLPDAEERPAGGRRRILVVDDNADSAESMAMMLRLRGDEVSTASDGLEAVEVAERFRPEVVLMDVGMPRMNGYEATRRIRELPWGRKVTVIALTGWGQDGDREQSKEAGCDGHLVKPVALPDLERLLAELRTSD